MIAAEPLPETLLAKESALKARLEAYGALAIAYSGGVDSAYLAEIAHEALGARAAMVLADSPSIPRSEVAAAEQLAQDRGWNFTRIATSEFENEAFLKNDGTRCYFCKSELFTRMDHYARMHGISVMAYGEIADDRLDPTRVGARAAKEHQVVAPLADAGLHKQEIRALSQRRGLPTWDKPSFACLSSRFPVGTRVDLDEMQKIEAAEELLKGLGFRQYRARHHGDICRIELDPADFARLLDPLVRAPLASQIRALGYKHVALDLLGYRTGSTAG
jgi:uncharacterized protein